MLTRCKKWINEKLWRPKNIKISVWFWTTMTTSIHAVHASLIWWTLVHQWRKIESEFRFTQNQLFRCDVGVIVVFDVLCQSGDRVFAIVRNRAEILMFWPPNSLEEGSSPNLWWVFVNRSHSDTIWQRSPRLSDEKRVLNRVSTTPGNPGNLLEFYLPSWKFLYKMSKIDCIGFQS